MNMMRVVVNEDGNRSDKRKKSEKDCHISDEEQEAEKSMTENGY